jgi:predicted HTH domain antitoxin
MLTVHVDLPDSVLRSLHRSPGELASELRLAAAVDWYHRGLLSQGRAAEVAGLSRADFIDALAERRIDVAQLDADLLEQDLGGA